MRRISNQKAGGFRATRSSLKVGDICMVEGLPWKYKIQGINKTTLFLGVDASNNGSFSLGVNVDIGTLGSFKKV